MSTTDSRHRRRLPIDVSGTAPVPLTRLVSVELRKALDTRAGRWFTFSIVVLVPGRRGDLALAAPDEADLDLRRLPRRRRRASSATSCRS